MFPPAVAARADGPADHLRIEAPRLGIDSRGADDAGAPVTAKSTHAPDRNAVEAQGECAGDPETFQGHSPCRHLHGFKSPRCEKHGFIVELVRAILLPDGPARKLDAFVGGKYWVRGQIESIEILKDSSILKFENVILKF